MYKSDKRFYKIQVGPTL